MGTRTSSHVPEDQEAKGPFLPAFPMKRRLSSGDVVLGYGPGPYVAVNMIFNFWKKLFAQWEYENGFREHRVRPSTEMLTLEPSKSGFV